MSNTNGAYDAIDTMSDEEIREFISELSTEERNAFKLQLMLKGRNIDDSSNDEDDDESYFIPEGECNDDFEIIIDDSKTKKKSRKKSKDTTVKKAVTSIIPIKDEFKSLPKDMTVSVILNAHSINYNEQDWPVNRRDVTYDLDLVTSPIQAKEVSHIFSEGSKSEEDKAVEGDIRYLVIRSFVEAIPTDAKCLGYIKITPKEGKLYKKIIINKAICKKNHIDYDITMGRVVSTLKNNGIS